MFELKQGLMSLVLYNNEEVVEIEKAISGFHGNMYLCCINIYSKSRG